MNFYRTPFILPILYPQLTWRIPTQEKIIYLTFDDGPVPGPTEFVLNELEKKNAQATFFCIGDNVFRNPSIFKKISEKHHTIGNHTFNHLKGWSTATERYVENVRLFENEISNHKSEISNLKSFFRPPYGRIKRSQIRALEKYKIIMWDVLTHDYLASLSEEKCLQGSIAATRPGSIVVFHDSYKAEKNMTYALPRYIDHFMNQGFVFKSIPLHGS